MKKKSKIFTNTKTKVTGDLELITKYETEWKDCDSALSQIRPEWRENEEVFFNKDKGKGAEDSKSNVNDGHLSTAIIQRTQRINAQQATGKVDYLDKKDRGKNQLLNLILQRYIIPNSNSQYKHLMKMKLISVYSQIYGKQPILVDYRVDDRYVGPDFWIIPVDRYYPQPGIFQDDDQDYCFVDQIQPLGWFKSLSKSTWMNIDKLVKKVKESKEKVSYVNQSYNEEKYNISLEGILIRTKYTREKWITYAPEYSEVGILREIDNPHKNNKLPVIVKQTVPLLDRSTGWGDTERGRPLQLTQNSILNLTLDSAKNKLYPITVVNPKGVVKNTLQRKAGAIWEETIPNSIRTFVNGQEDLNVFNSLSGYVLSSINNMLGTTDMSSSKTVDMTQGKTPQALKMQQIKESAADAWERQSMEEFVEDLYDRMIDMIAQNQTKPIDLNLFAGEIDQIKEIFPDIEEVYNKDGQGKYVIKPNMLKGKFRFFIDSGTTVQKDAIEENQSLTNIITLLGTPFGGQIRQEMQKKGKDIDISELIKRYIITSGTADSDKIIVDFKPEPINPGMPGQEVMPPQGMEQQMPPEMGGQMPPQGMPQGQPMPQGGGVDSASIMQSIRDPQLQQVAQQLLGGKR